MTAYDAIILTGGGSTRLGTDKTRIVVDGLTVFERVLAAVAHAERRLVVGPERPEAQGSAGVARWLREEPPGSGPANAVVYAATEVTAPMTVVVAGDLPYVGPDTIARLVAAARGDRDGAVLRDVNGRPQWLSVAVTTASLRRRIGARSHWSNRSMHELLSPLDLAAVAASPDESHDIDTPEDIPSDS